MVSLEEATAIAERVASRFSNLWQLSFEDRVHECLVRYLELQKEGIFFNKQYLFKAFHSKMLDIARRYKVDDAHLQFDDAVEKMDVPEEKVERKWLVVALPKEWRPTRRFVEILLEKGCVRDAADAFGISYTRADHWWRRAREKAKEMVESGNYSPDEVIAMVEITV